MALINVTEGPRDGNDGEVRKLDYMVGNRRYGQKVYISGVESAVETRPPRTQWADFETLTVSTTALAFTDIRAQRREIAFLTVEVAPVRYRVDGQVPTATTGHVLEVGDTLLLEGNSELDQFRVIRRDAADATVFVSYGVRRYD